jgi:MoxR-like ATPase
MKDLRDRVATEVGKAFVGSDEHVDSLLIAAASGGHVLIEGPPGVAKTLLANAFARAIGVGFKRIQFTPDMLPSDVTGTMTVRADSFEFRPGPIFTNVVLGDEVNRTPPKTQAALLEAMQEGQVTVDGEPRPLPQPFIVLATQNPIEYEGTYPLPEAQLDRFLMRIEIGYPTQEQESDVLRVIHRGVAPMVLETIDVVASPEDLAAARDAIDGTSITDEVATYLVNVVRATRDLPSVSLGASPRAAIHLLVVAKARALLSGRDYVTPDDVVDVAERVLAHRLVLSPEAELERYSPRDAVSAAVRSVPVPR